MTVYALFACSVLSSSLCAPLILSAGDCLNTCAAAALMAAFVLGAAEIDKAMLSANNRLMDNRFLKFIILNGCDCF